MNPVGFPISNFRVYGVCGFVFKEAVVVGVFCEFKNVLLGFAQRRSASF
jgi:hypothetical protein